MITCPECGEVAQDNAKFCDRCGQGLTGAAATSAPVASRPKPLAVGATLKGGFEIVETLPGSSIENRYRVRRTPEGKTESFIIRERLSDRREESSKEESPDLPAEAAPTPDPNGPTAKTAELKPPPVAQASAPGESESAEMTAAEPTPSGESETAEPPPAASNGATTKVEAAPSLAEEAVAPATGQTLPAQGEDDLGEVFGRVLALSLTLKHPAFQRAIEGFAQDGRVYLVYQDEDLTALHRGSSKTSEPEALAATLQVCQAIAFVHRRGLRLNDICPQSIAVTRGGRIKLTGLDYVSNDNELQAEPIFNDGYTAPEIYRGKRVDKRADIFSAGALLYTWLTGDRLESESWREEAGVVRFYPPHVVTPDLEQAVRRALLFDAKDRWETIDDFKTELVRLLGIVQVSAAVLSDVGMVREHNEDAVMAVEYRRDSLVEPAENHLYAVCDGMGGAEAGEIAAAIAVATIRGYVQERLAGADMLDPCKVMVAALEEANSKIIEYQTAHPESRGMGSTGVTALVLPPEVALAWVGDSRAYFLEGEVLKQVTKDHSLVQRLVEIGQISAEEAKHHEHKNVITRSLGARQSGPAGAESIALKLRRGDRILLCSDGLTAHVDDPEIAKILRRHGSPAEAARELIAAANAGGGTDNISVAVVFAN
ncbi:MAG TPA: Stp1/IreP family PP2C-type Ser/Thr phosphatase [Candidatus Binataceae bacterium]|nr:Stp1/IreP family PP2C-type Ser/Thr phosphatase [Candidatus Binataceae bacterium]